MRGKDDSTVVPLRFTGITPAYAGKSQVALEGRCVLRDHPRVCGEKVRRLYHLMSLRGSPPRMRGKGFSLSGVNVRIRITPAYAGKSRWSGNRAPRGWDHPRVCGEKPHIYKNRQPTSGSPPRMRGKAESPEQLKIRERITPAYAGKSPFRKSTHTLREDHPRVCGEKRPELSRPGAPLGSPPRMRGKAVLSATSFSFAGITPAYAGKSASCCSPESAARDHPRVCGEKAQREGSAMWHKGSPPRMRGKVVHFAIDGFGQRITPAYAGKSIWWGLHQQDGGDHPRVCGEKRSPHQGCHSGRGSPPRMRGKENSFPKPPPVYGITPAYAGKRKNLPPLKRKNRDHPRVCGEKGWG